MKKNSMVEHGNPALVHHNDLARAVSACFSARRIKQSRAFGRAAVLGLLVGVPIGAESATFTVTNRASSGPGSLQQAMLDADANPGRDEIVFSNVTGTINGQSLPYYVGGVDLKGPGAGVLTISHVSIELSWSSITGLAIRGGCLRGSDLTIKDSIVSGCDGNGVEILSGATIENSAISDHGGSGIWIGEDGFVEVIGSTISGNGEHGIYGYDSLINVRGSTISGNQQDAVYGDYLTYVQIDDSVISDNFGSAANVYGRRYTGEVIVNNTTVTNNGSGIHSFRTRIANSTFSGNRGWAVSADDVELLVTNSTISGNFGGIFVAGGAAATISNSTVVDNSRNGIYAQYDPNNYYKGPCCITELKNVIVSGNGADAGRPDIEGEKFSVEYSLIENVGSTAFEESVPGSNIIGQASRVDPLLKDNGGPTKTHALLSGSPARDAGDPAFTGPPDSDQRGAGYPRVVDGRIDMGAIEVQGDGQLGDLVWEDTNGDGIQDADENGKPDVTVRLRECGGDVLANLVTRPNGRFRFAGLGRGNYRLEFIAPNGFAFSPPLQGSKRGKDSDPDPATGLTGCRFVNNKKHLNMDAGLVMRPAGTAQIGDFVWDDRNGDGIQDAGEPGIGGVTARLLDCNGSELARTMSDNNGNYRFSDLVAGGYKIGIIPPSGARLSPARQGNKRGKDSDPDPTTGETGCFGLNDGQNKLGIDAGLILQPAGTGKIGDRVWEDLDGDGIQDGGEPGLADVTVNLQDCSGNVLMTTRSNAGGGYLFNRLTAASYQVEFVSPLGFDLSPAKQGNKGGKDSDPDPNTGLSDCRALADGQSRLGVDAGMVRQAGGAGKIGDYVWRDSDGDGHQDNTESGLAGVRVELRNCNGTVLDTTTTNGNGVYQFTGLPAASYRVHFVAPPGLSFSAQGQSTGGKDSDPNPNTGTTACKPLAEGQSRTGIDAGLN